MNNILYVVIPLFNIICKPTRVLYKLLRISCSLFRLKLDKFHLNLEDKCCRRCCEKI